MDSRWLVTGHSPSVLTSFHLRSPPHHHHLLPLMVRTSSPHVSTRCMLLALLCLSLLSLLPAAAAGAASCQSYTGVSPAPQLWSAVVGSAAIVTGPVYVLSPLVYDVSGQQVVGGIFINATGAIYAQDKGTGQSATLTTDFISVEGLLQVGSTACPLLSVFTFQIDGLAPMPYLAHSTPTPMLKAIVIWMGGSIEMHGAKGLVAPTGNGASWTRLEGNLAAGATVATLADNVHTGSINDWQVGDRIIVGTTDYVSIPSHTNLSLPHLENVPLLTSSIRIRCCCHCPLSLQ